jgi:hypothetical protein
VNNIQLNFSVRRLNCNISSKNSNVGINRPVINANIVKKSIVASAQPKTINMTAKGAIVYTGTGVIACEAGETISALKCVQGDSDSKIYICSNIDAFAVMGVAISSATIGGMVNVRTSGLLEDSSWNWIEDIPIFCSTDGILSQTPPTEGYMVQMGVPKTPTSMVINIQKAVKLI